MAREKNLDNKVLSFLKEQGAWRIKYWAGAKFTKSGVPDILACVDSYFFGIEDKNDDGKPTVLQLKNLEWIHNAGGFAILLYPNDFDNFKKFIVDGLDNLSEWQFDWYYKNRKLQKEWFKKLQ